MVTSEQLWACSTKKSLQDTLAHAKANDWLDDFLKYRRHPDTIVGGVLTVEAVDALWTNPNRDMMVHGCGICHWTNNQVVFLTDDSQFAWTTLKERGWVACSFRHRGTAHQRFDSWALMLAHYEAGNRLLSSEQELLDYLNQGAHE